MNGSKGSCMGRGILECFWKKRQPLWIAIALGVLFWMGTGTADAHRVMVFAWVEGDTVHVESKFPGGKKVQEGRVLVYDSEGTLLLEGVSDEQGRFQFQVPRKSSLKIVLEAGMGHRAEWTIPAEEIEGAVPQASKRTRASQEPGEQEKAGSTPPSGGVSAQELEVAVEKVLDKKLQPIVRMLAESHHKGPSLSDILGGIGYIVGLAGLATYAHYRRKIRERSAGIQRQETE